MGVPDYETLHALMGDPVVAALLQAHMDALPISASLGPIDRLILRLQWLADFKHTLPKGHSWGDILFLSEHLKELCHSLKKVSEMEDTSYMAKWWMKEVRELCYDTEDYMEEVMMQSRAGARWSWGRIASIFVRWFQSKPKGRRPQLSQFIDRAIGLRKTFTECIEEENNSEISPKKVQEADAYFGDKADVGRLPSELVNQLAFDDNKQKQLKVVAISGCAGAGKTALASTVYLKYKRKFQCRAFVRVSRNPDFRSLLTSVLSQVKAAPPQDFPDVQGLIHYISKYLQGKRYFIVIDDVWRPSVWDIISRAFPDDSLRSRIVVTTQSEQVEAAYFGYNLKFAIFKMAALNDSCTSTSSKEKRKVLILRYNNLPLHLKTCLLYLSMYPEDCTITKDDLVKQWVTEGFIPALERHRTDEISEVPQVKCGEISEAPEYRRDEIQEVPQVKCGEISEAPEYRRDKIQEVPQDQREGIEEVSQDERGDIAKVPQDKREEIARGYFDELVTRGMVQPVDRNHKGEVLSCTVHHMVLDLIRHKSKEENFTVIVDDLESTIGHPDIVRRLSVQFVCEKGASIPESIILSQVRSLAFYGFLRCVPTFAEYGLLRVLILNIWADKNNTFDLTRMGELYHLRYLKIECNITVRLPSEIRMLQHLSTLQVDARLCDVPSGIVHLEKLLHLRLLSECILPHGIGRMTSLRTLGYFDLGTNSEDNVRNLGELENLQDLQLTCSAVQPAKTLEKNMQLVLGTVLQRLSILQTVTLSPAAGSSPVNIPCDGFSIASSHMSLFLRRIELSWRCCIFFSLPHWLGQLRKLTVLKIGVRSLSKEDIDILKGLPALTALTLYILKVPKGWIIFEEGFPVLTYFKFICAVSCLYFRPGAMLSVQKLQLGFNAVPNNPFNLRSTNFIELTSLTEICVKCGTRVADEFHRPEALLESDVSYHPNTPIISVQCVDVMFYGEEEKDEIEEEGSEEDKNNEVDETYEIEEQGSVEVADNRKKRSSTGMVDVLVDVVGSVVTIVEIALKINGVVETVKTEKKVCREIGDRTKRLSDILSLLTDMGVIHHCPVIRPVVSAIERILAQAFNLVTACQKWSIINKFFRASDLSEKLDRVNKDISDRTLDAVFAMGCVQSATIQLVCSTLLEDATVAESGLIDCFVGINMEAAPASPGFTIFSLSEIDGATNNFSDSTIIRKASHATVYKGEFSDGLVVGIRRFNDPTTPARVLPVLLQHENVVRCLGYCHEAHQDMVVEEYMPKGPLSEIINGLSEELDWCSILKIIRGVAKGVAYLHLNRVIHLDLKPESIFFDPDMNPKICDFENSKILNQDVTEEQTPELVGTLGYIPPEYIAHGIISLKSDVFSFGVLLLYVFNRIIQRGELDKHPIVYAWEIRESQRMNELFEPSSLLKELERFTQIGLLCAQELPEDRPTMALVLEMLNYEENLPTPKKPGFVTEIKKLPGISSLNPSVASDYNPIRATTDLGPSR